MSLDFMKNEIRAKLRAALDSDKPDELVSVIAEMGTNIQGNLLEEMRAYQQTNDASILAKRGIKPLTSTEKKFWEAAKTAIKTGDVKAAFTGIENGLPEETVSRILEDMRAQFPLLDEINMLDAQAVTKILINTQGLQYAAWGALGAKITNELSGAISEIDLTLCKLLAVVPVSTDMLDAGVEWLEAYARGILVESAGSALSKASVSGSGNNEPIGMIKNLNGNVSGGVYPNKTAKSITYLDAETLGDIFADLSVNGNSQKQRAVDGVIFVVNPKTYFKKVIPAIRTYCVDGSYKDELPFPVKFIMEPEMDDNKAVIGIGKEYMLGVGKGGKQGSLTYSDDVLFLDDMRAWKLKLYANGRPMDNNAFVYLNLAGLVKKPITVNTIDVTPERDAG